MTEHAALQVVPGRFLGQVVVGEPTRRLTEDEFISYLEVSDGCVQFQQMFSIEGLARWDVFDQQAVGAA